MNEIFKEAKYKLTHKIVDCLVIMKNIRFGNSFTFKIDYI